MITDKQYDAADKFRAHFHLAGMDPRVTPVYGVESFSSSPNDRLPAGERQAHFRAELHKAIDALKGVAGQVEAVTRQFVLEETDLVTLGRAHCGFRQEAQARAAAQAVLAIGLETLVGWYGV